MANWEDYKTRTTSFCVESRATGKTSCVTIKGSNIDGFNGRVVRIEDQKLLGETGFFKTYQVAEDWALVIATNN